MSLQEDFIANKEIDNAFVVENETAYPINLESQKKSLERNLETLLNDIGIKNMSVIDNGSESESVTMNDDVKSESVLSIPCESEDFDNICKDSARVSVNIGTESIPLIGAHTSVIESPLIHEVVSKMAEENDEINQNVIMDLAGEISVERYDENDLHSVSSIIIVNNGDTVLSNEKTPDLQLFTEQLNKLSATIQQKDEEIKKLSQKLLELENKSKIETKMPFKGSSITSSNESISFREDIEEKLKTNLVEVDKSDDSKLKNDCVNISVNDIKFSHHSSVIGSERISPTENFLPSKLETEVIPGLKQKLSDLEDEVKRLQRANVDSVLTLQSIQNSIPAFEKPLNETIINRLLVDHSLLKEELDQLKWEHSKLAQPNVLGEEIKQLKTEVSVLRTQNERLQQYIKSSSTKSLNKSPDHGACIDHVEDFGDQENYLSKPRPFVDNQSSDYIFEKLNSRRKVTSGTPNVSSMLKHSIESLESPYRATCQSIQHMEPFNGAGNETYRTRKLSDSSSNLIDDTTPRVWLEPVSTNGKAMYFRPTKTNEISQKRPEFDQYSVDSFVTVTTSVTETDRDNWGYLNRNGLDAFVPRKDESDLLSTADSSDTVLDSTSRDDYKKKPKYSYSFTPKSPIDLTLDDLVKFARPGGKMSTGRVCFVGHLPGRREVCVGIELDEDAGKHDGVFERVRYFQCRKNRGVFISFHKIILAYKSI